MVNVLVRLESEPKMKYMEALEFSKETGIPYSTVIHYMNEGKINWEVIGDRYMIPSTELGRLDEIEHPRTTAERLVGGPVLAPNEVADLLDVSKPTIISWCSSGQMKHIESGARFFIPESEAKQWQKYKKPIPYHKWLADHDAMGIRDFCALAEMNYLHVLKIIDRGKLKATKICKQWCITKKDAADYIVENCL